MAKQPRRPTDGNLGYDPYLYVSAETGEIRHLIERSVKNTYRLFSGKKTRPIAHFLSDTAPVFNPKDVAEYSEFKKAQGWGADLLSKHIEALRAPAKYTLSVKKALSILKVERPGVESGPVVAKADPVAALFPSTTIFREPESVKLGTTLMQSWDKDLWVAILAAWRRATAISAQLETAGVGTEQFDELVKSLNLPKGVFFNWNNNPEGKLGVKKCYCVAQLSYKLSMCWVLPEMSAAASGYILIIASAYGKDKPVFPTVVMSAESGIGKALLANGLMKQGSEDQKAEGTALLASIDPVTRDMAFSIANGSGKADPPSPFGSVSAAVVKEVLAGSTDNLLFQWTGNANLFTPVPADVGGSASSIPKKGFIYTLGDGLQYYEIAIVGLAQRTILGVTAFGGSHLYQAGKMGLPAMADVLEWQLKALDIKDKERTNAMATIEKLRAAKDGVCSMVWYADKQSLPFDALQYVPAEKFAERAEMSLKDEIIYDGIDMTWGKAQAEVNKIRSSDEFLVLSEQELNKAGLLDPLLIGSPTTHRLSFDRGPSGIECTLALAAGGLVGSALDIEDIRCYTQAGYPWVYGLALKQMEQPEAEVLKTLFPGEKMSDLIVNDPLTGAPVSPGGMLEYRMDISRMYEDDFLFYHRVAEDDRPLVALLTQGVAQTKEPRAVLRSSLIGNYAMAMVPLHLFDDLDVAGGDLAQLG